MTTALDQARAFFHQGVAAYEAGRLEQAERDFAAALALAPGRPSVLTNLGAVRLKLGRLQEALDLLEEALAAEPDNLEAVSHAAVASAELGRIDRAVVLFQRAVALDPARPMVWTQLGQALKEAGRATEAAAAFREALARGGDASLNAFYLAALTGEAAPRNAPRAYVEALFDNYAAAFDQHLVAGLGYDAPNRLLRPLADEGVQVRHALDLGCGTGLCGPLLRPLAQRVTGVDLSQAMLDRARATGAYDELVQADAAAFLAGTGDRHDLVVAADVFIYIGALDEVFAGVAARMQPGGLFLFSVEEPAHDEPELALRVSLRYAHAEPYVRRLADAHGFTVEALARAPVRQDQQVAIPGLYVRLRRNGG